MQHKNRWLNRTRLTVNTLESRMQPGSILINGIDMGVAAEVVAQPEQTSAPIKRIKDSEDIQIVTPAVTVAQVASPSQVTVSRPATTQSSQPINQMTLNPAIYTPQTPQASSNVVGRNVIRRETTAQKHSNATWIDLNDQIAKSEGGQLARTSSQRLANAAGGGVKAAPEYVSYDASGTNRADGVNDTALGVGALDVNYYTCGFQGRSGTVRMYGHMTGALVASATFPPDSGNRIQIRGCDVSPTTGEVFVVGTERTAGGAVVQNFVHKIGGALGGAPHFKAEYDGTGAQDTSYTPADGVDALEEISVSPAGTDVFVAGTLNVGGQDDIADFHYSADLVTFSNLGGWTFGAGVPSNGYSVDSDGVNRYLGGDIDVGKEDFYMAVDYDDVTLPWGGGISIGCFATVPKPSNGMYGVTVDPTGTDLYLAGTTNIPDGVFNPPVGADPEYDAVLEGKTDTATGLAFSYGFCYGILEGDWAAQAGDTNFVDGGHFTAGWVDDFGSAGSPTPGNHAADISEFDATGTFVATRTVGDLGATGDPDGVPNSKSMSNRGISIYFLHGIVAGGETNVGIASMAQYGNDFVITDQVVTNDSDYGAPGAGPLEGPPTDGHYIAELLPLGV